MEVTANEMITSTKVTVPNATLANIAEYELMGRKESTFITIPSGLESWNRVAKYTTMISSITPDALLEMSSVLDTSAPMAPYINA